MTMADMAREMRGPNGPLLALLLALLLPFVASAYWIGSELSALRVTVEKTAADAREVREWRQSLTEQMADLRRGQDRVEWTVQTVRARMSALEGRQASVADDGGPMP